VFSILAASVLGAAVGAEREWRRHPGGLRSCALIATAAAVFARMSIEHGGAAPGAALGAVATGVGFLGAGVIMRNGDHIRGLSTAATFWAVAALGVAAALEEYTVAITLTLVVFFAHIVLRPLSTWIENRAPPEEDGPQ
jgi:putative Mg2+ transporter-C (MgtC) family protein